MALGARGNRSDQGGCSGPAEALLATMRALATTTAPRRERTITVDEILVLWRHPLVMPLRRRRGQAAYASGLAAEDAACAALINDGWIIRARRLRTKAGEVDAVAEKAGVLSIIEIKSRPSLAEAAIALTARQQGRLVASCEIILAEHPEWGLSGVRFDVLLVNPAGQMRRIADAFRPGDPVSYSERP